MLLRKSWVVGLSLILSCVAFAADHKIIKHLPPGVVLENGVPVIPGRDCEHEEAGKELSSNDPQWTPCKALYIADDDDQQVFHPTVLDDVIVRPGQLYFNISAAIDLSANSNGIEDSKFNTVNFDLTNDKLEEGQIFGYIPTTSDKHQPIIYGISIKVSPIVVFRPLVNHIGSKVYQVRRDQGEAYAHEIVDKQVTDALNQLPAYKLLPPIVQKPIHDALTRTAYNTIAAKIVAQEEQEAQARLQSRLGKFLRDQTIQKVKLGIAFRFFNNNSVGVKLGKYIVANGGPRDENGQTELQANSVGTNRIQDALSTSPTKAFGVVLKHEFSDQAVLTAEFNMFNNKAGGSLINAASADLTAPDGDLASGALNSKSLSVDFNSKYIEMHVSEGSFAGHRAEGAGFNIHIPTNTTVTFDVVHSDRAYDHGNGTYLDKLSSDYSMSDGWIAGVSQKIMIAGHPVVVTLTRSDEKKSFIPIENLAPFDHHYENTLGLTYMIFQGTLHGYPVQLKFGGEVVQSGGQATFTTDEFGRKESVVSDTNNFSWDVGITFKAQLGKVEPPPQSAPAPTPEDQQ